MYELTIKEAVQQMSEQELNRWQRSACARCKYFNGFFTEEGYPVYYNCQAHNTTGFDFVEAMLGDGYCSFWKPIGGDNRG